MITRNEAINLGLPVFFTGKPCIYGHIAERRVCNYHCVECASEKNAAYKNNKFDKEYQRAWKLKNKEKVSNYRKSFSERNKDRLNQYQKKWRKTKNGRSIEFIRASLKRCLFEKEAGNDCSVIGYRYLDLVASMESKFIDGMSWENHGEWHIDHIKPIKAFLDEGETDPKIINALSNLQPLWAIQNLSKGSKYNESV